MIFNRSIVFASIIGAVFLYLLVTGIYQNGFRNPYPESDSSLLNLTADHHVWQQAFYHNDTFIKEVYGPLPDRKFGHNAVGATRIVYKTTLQLTEQTHAVDEPALHYLRIFATSFKVFGNDVLLATNETHDPNDNIKLRRALAKPGPLELRIELETYGVGEPGFDLRAMVLIGDKSKLDRITNRISERDHALVLWMFIPCLVTALLFSLGSVIFSFSREYHHFAAYCLLSGLSMAAMYGRLPGVPDGIDHATLSSTFKLISLACLLVFVRLFFRHKSKYVAPLAAGLFLIAVGHFVVSSYATSTSSVFLSLFHFTLICQTMISFYGVYAAAMTFRTLRHSGRSRSRLVISGVLLAVFLASIPFLFIWALTSNQYWLGGQMFELAFIMTVAACVSIDIGKVRAERDVIRQKFGIFTDEQKVNAILHGKLNESIPVTQATAMFIDVRGFCVLSELFEEQAVFRAMSDYYRIVIQCIHRHGGIVDKFMGDGILAVWGMAESLTNDHAWRCAKAAIDLRNEMKIFNTKRFIEGSFPLCIGIGIHSGPVTSGIIGAENRAEFTVVGSTINFASRVEKESKVHRSDILMSDVTYDLIKDRVVVCRRGNLELAEGLIDLTLYHLAGVVDHGKVVHHEPAFIRDLENLNAAGLVSNLPNNLNIPRYLSSQLPEVSGYPKLGS